MTEAPPAKKSDLGVRTASAVVMLAVAGTALWLGGWWWTAFVAAVALGVLWEWVRLAFAFAKGPVSQAMWLLAGVVYIGLGMFGLAGFGREGQMAVEASNVYLGAIVTVIAVDIGAYLFGRALGGPKIAPSISPSKTWSGLLGGIVGAYATSILLARFGSHVDWGDIPVYFLILLAAVVAVLAQIGDFFESWMKRKAGVKDSGNLIPGHGGLFDRVDGQLAVLAALGALDIWLSLQPAAPRAPLVY